MTLPRPEITDALGTGKNFRNNIRFIDFLPCLSLGIGYRRIPILAIGNDVYCDTNHISAALERQFSASQGFPTIFPNRKDGGKAETGLIKALAAFYADRPLFSLASTALPYNKFTPEFIEDRNKVSSLSFALRESCLL